MKTTKNNEQKTTRVIAVIICLTFLALLTACRGCGYKSIIDDHPCVWVCDNKDFKLEFLATGFRIDHVISSTLYLDGKPYEVTVVVNEHKIVIMPEGTYKRYEDFDNDEEYFRYYADPDIILFEGTYDYYPKITHFTYTITTDRTNRTDKESLVGRKFVFRSQAITPPQEQETKERFLWTIT